MTKLFVGNLPFTATEESGRTLLSPHGTIESLALINDGDTDPPRGIGSVAMPTGGQRRYGSVILGTEPCLPH